jgi:hypothetical protein
MLSEAFHAVQSSRGRQLLAAIPAAIPFVFVNIQLSMLLVQQASKWNIRMLRFLGNLFLSERVNPKVQRRYSDATVFGAAAGLVLS